MIPDELSALLPPRPREAAADPRLEPGDRPPDVVLDLVHFLTYLQGNSVHPLHGRWLAPGHFRALSTTLTQPDPSITTARSELETGYLRFLHYLAETSGLAAPVAARLKPTPNAWIWLDGADAGRYHTLIGGWTTDLDMADPSRSLWQRYRLPGGPALVATTLDLLDDLAPGVHVPEAVAAALRERCILRDILPADGDVRTPLRALLKGPLAWMGRASLAPVGGEPKIHVTPWPMSASTNPDAPASAGPALLTVHEQAIRLVLPEPPARPELKPLFALALPAVDSDAATGYARTRQLTRTHFAELLSRGLSPDWIIARLSELTHDALTPEAVQRLQRWEVEVRSVSLRQLVVLTVADPAVFEMLTVHRGLRPLLRETLSPHHIAIAPDGLHALLRVLHRDGWDPLVGPEVRGALPASALAPASPFVTDPTVAGHLWLALRLLYSTADLLSLPGLPPGELLEQLAAGAGAGLPALEATAGRIEESLREAIDGYTPYPAPLPGVDLAQIRTTVEAALAQDRPLEIVYHTAGRGERTIRVVEPLRVETYHGAAYLVAFCRLRQDERVFRLDRIERATPVTDDPP